MPEVLTAMLDDTVKALAFRHGYEARAYPEHIECRFRCGGHTLSAPYALDCEEKDAPARVSAILRGFLREMVEWMGEGAQSDRTVYEETTCRT